MTIAIILAGGTGSRIRSDIPKQFIELSGQMMIMHALAPFGESDMIDNIQIVADESWREKIEDAIIKMIIENQDINKPTGLGEVGSRLVSLYPDFDVRSYGYNMLSKFLEEFTRIQMVKHGNIVSVTLREDQDLKENIDSYVVQIVKKAGKAGVELSTLGNKMYEKYKDFKIRDYGYSQFNQYVKSLKHVRVEQEGTILKAVYKG